MRRATAPVAVLIDTSVEPTGDLVSPLVQALDDPSVAVAGGWGITSGDLRKFEDAPAGEVDAIEGYLLAFRRADYVARGPLDERFRFYRNLDIWWSLVLRDEGEGNAPRRAVRLDGLPAVRHEHRGYTSLPDDERDRQSKRNFYRIIDRFGSRRDLLVHPAVASAPRADPTRSPAERGGSPFDCPSRSGPRTDLRAGRRIHDVPAERVDPRPETVGRRIVARRPGDVAVGDEGEDLVRTAVSTASVSQTRWRSRPRTASASRTSQRRSSGTIVERRISRSSARATGMSRSSSIAATNRSWNARPSGDRGADGVVARSVTT